ncbi:MAG: sulfite exporter TauE/SafE family protein [Actinobacteria bacterium]|nr:sulfite exporter TauE/SafE family protein [Actinomycetota bacterium]MBV9252773.1 sulfite exporter TauE/SafE family protein [Actinomycetota bacterium]
MHFDGGVAAAGLIVGFVVGLTGMGGGALMTPILVLIFNVQPLAAVSSDLVASVIMKPVGAGVHLRRGTVHKELVRWLVIGSVPSAFLGVIILKQLGHGDAVQNNLKLALGIALLVASASIVAKTALQAFRPVAREHHGPLAVKPVPTALIGVAGGLVVGMTSVGSGSLMIVMLLLLYPMLSASELVGTDLVQAIPLVASAALGHLLFGDFKLGLTASLLVGCLPGVYIGARVSAKAPDRIIRPALVFALLASALKLLNEPTTALGITLGVAAVFGLPAFYWLSNRPTRVPVDA